MRKTQTVVFDYGETLVHEEELDVNKGYKKIYSILATDSTEFSYERFCNNAKEIYDYVYGLKKDIDIELVFQNYLRLLVDFCGFDFNGDFTYLEREFVDASYTVSPIDGAIELLSYLNENNIAVAVLSNTTVSGECLRFLLKKVFPTQNFLFVMTSSDYLIKKPEKFLFDTMQKKCGVEKSNILFCGDKPHRDIEGAKRAGIRGVLLDPQNIFEKENCIKIKNLKEIINIIEAEVQNEV